MLGVSKEQPRGHFAWAEGKEGRKINSRQNTQVLRGLDEEGRFYSLAGESHGRVSSQGEDIFDVFIRSELHLFCGGGTVGREGLSLASRGGGHAWTSGGSAVVRMGEVWALFCGRTRRICS